MDNKIIIGFRLEDGFGNKYSQESTLEVLTSFGDRDIDMIGRQLNYFLKQCGYIRRNDNIFMEDITDEEYEALADYLMELRKECK